jgi:hypothetical protein
MTLAQFKGDRVGYFQMTSCGPKFVCAGSKTMDSILTVYPDLAWSKTLPSQTSGHDIIKPSCCTLSNLRKFTPNLFHLSRWKKIVTAKIRSASDGRNNYGITQQRGSSNHISQTCTQMFLCQLFFFANAEAIAVRVVYFRCARVVLVIVHCR